MIPKNVRTVVVQHMGLGDAVICNGLTRELVRRYPVPLGVFCKRANFESVAWMYRDLANDIVLIDAGERPPPSRERYEDIWELCDKWEAQTGGIVKNLTMFRENRLHYLKHGHLFDTCFYHYAAVPFTQKWKCWTYRRDRSVEIKPPDGPYALVHDDPSRGYVIDRSRLPSIPVYQIRHWRVRNVFALRQIAEHASELHVINSAFLNLFDFWEPKGQLFWHYYARRWEGQSDPSPQLDWTLLH